MASDFFTNITKEGSQVAFGKFGFEGPPGSGKTTTAALLAVGISKEFHNGAPVVWVDSENGANFIRPIFLAEKVDLLVVATRSLADLKRAVHEAKKVGACALVPDSVTRFWTTLVSDYMAQHKLTSMKQMLSHWNTVKEPWREWTDLYINCALHVIACGRGGFEYEQVDVIDEQGNVNTETVKGDFKMKAEGEFGHEPDVNLHFQAMTDPNAPKNIKTRRKGPNKNVQLVAPRKIHVATVQKGRVWQLNGQVFQWADRDAYKPGEYKLVLECFRPYFDALNLGGKHTAVASGENQFAGDAETNRSYLRKKVALEEWDTHLNIVFPASTAKNKVLRQLTGEAITGGITSKTAFQRQSPEQIEFEVAVLKKFRERLATEGLPEAEADVQALIEIAREEVNSEMAVLNPPPHPQEMAQDQPF